ncbi:MAG: S8 family serine peptidase [Bdellovibrionota bacterium]
MLQTLFTILVCFSCFSFAFARVVSSSIPYQIKNSWWLSSKEAASIFNGSKKFNVQFDNSKPIVIAILDTGIDFSHPYLKNHEFKPENGTAHFNFYTGTNEARDLMDVAGHGTHVAGIVLATIQKANPKANVKFISLKILPDPKPERSSMAIPKVSPNVIRNVSGNIGLYLKEASRYLVKLKKEGVNVLALNASYGGYTYDQNEKEALAFLSRNDILVAAAAGNDAKKLTKMEFTFKNEQGQNLKCIAYSKEKPCPAKIFKNFYPAAYNAELDNIIAVGNVNRNGLLGKSSNFGSSVDIFAPGEDIASSIPGGEYELKTGTSMATPQVTASLALLKSAHPTKTNLEIKRILLDNSIFNDYYVDKSSSASRLNIPYLFKKRATKYSVKSLMKLKPSSFTNDSAKITRDVPCMMSSSNKILCGPEIYRTKILVNGKEQTIAEVLGAKNIERQKAMNLGFLNKGQIIESSLNMTIKSISKNEKIFQLMLKHGFAFSELYHSLGKEFLDKNYSAQVIVPVLSFTEFKENYPPGTRVDRELYAKYIKDIINTPPQFLNRFKSVYLPRLAPDLKVEIGLTKIFPLPLTENLISFIAKNNSPDADAVLKRLPDSFVKKTKDKELILRVKNLKENTPVIALTKKDLKYLDGFNQVDTKADALVSAGLSGAGYRPASKESFEGIKKAFKAAIPIEKVAGIEVRNLDSSKEIQLPNKILNRLESMETALLAVSLTNQKNLAKRVAKTASITKKGKKLLYHALKKDALVLNNEQNIQLDPLKVSTNIFRPRAKARERIGEREQKYFKMLLDRFLVGNRSQLLNTVKMKVVPRENSVIDDLPLAQVETQQEKKTLPNSIGQTSEVDKKLDISNQHFSCDLNTFENLLNNVKTHQEEAQHASYFSESFCNGGKNLSLNALQKHLPTLKYYSYCSTIETDKNFEDLLDDGFQQSSCRKPDVTKSCRDRLLERTVEVCNKITGEEFQVWQSEGITAVYPSFFKYLSKCRSAALNQPNIPKNYFSMNFEKSEKISGILNRVKSIGCSDNVRYRKFRTDFRNLSLNETLFNEASKYRIKEISRIRNKEKMCEEATSYIDFLEEQVKLTVRTKVNIDKTALAIEFKKQIRPEKWSNSFIKSWLLYNKNINKIEDLINRCETVQPGGNSPVNGQSR